jgi:hypothetical protein
MLLTDDPEEAARVVIAAYEAQSQAVTERARGRKSPRERLND